MSPSRRTNAAFAALVTLAGIAAALAPLRASAAGPKPPKQLCVVWTNGADAGDTWEMNLLVRAVPGKIAAKFADQTPAVLRFYELDGMAAVPPGALFPNLHGTGWGYAGTDLLVLAIAADTDAGTFLFRGSLALTGPTGGFTRISPDGSTAAGTYSIRSCAEVVIED